MEAVSITARQIMRSAKCVFLHIILPKGIKIQTSINYHMTPWYLEMLVLLEVSTEY